jgi:hypothetical protein
MEFSINKATRKKVGENFRATLFAPEKPRKHWGKSQQKFQRRKKFASNETLLAGVARLDFITVKKKAHRNARRRGVIWKIRSNALRVR